MITTSVSRLLVTLFLRRRNGEGRLLKQTLPPEHVRSFGLNSKYSRPVPKAAGRPCSPAGSARSLRGDRPGTSGGLSTLTKRRVQT
jgi:hypothetical protein